MVEIAWDLEDLLDSNPKFATFWLWHISIPPFKKIYKMGTVYFHMAVWVPYEIMDVDVPSTVPDNF